MLIREGSMATSRPERYAKQLAGHWARKGRIGEREGATVIDLDGGQSVELRPEPNTLRLRVSVPPGGDVDRFARVVQEHLERFAAREELTVTWSGGADDH